MVVVLFRLNVMSNLVAPKYIAGFIILLMGTSIIYDKVSSIRLNRCLNLAYAKRSAFSFIMNLIKNGLMYHSCRLKGLG